ncbi:PREDICTED: aspartic proteinase oryzasin-1-like [Camelina sativa]|uniref:Aspartic proteinase oryzasin-1-like n=1 Tax=Camelina sativa TaxID=90675 RepID=A0ABM0URW8_CAMSA|nr:PREDICTED: aspartic proteinase oryzasin-1-like [Camelina sativa]
MMKQGKIEKKIFSIWLGRSRDSGAGGEIVFGGTNPAHYTGQHTYVTVKGRRHSFQMNNIFVGKADTKRCSRGCKVFVDSGTTNIISPTAMIKDINDRIKLSPDCKKLNKLPDVTFTIGGRSFSVRPRDYVRRKSDNVCTSRFEGDDKVSLWILGMPFIRAFYTVYDYTKPPNVNIGFAPSV